ncbi:hypothetical protein I204_01781 [Kwoniella mangroviensis CBS 8886]|nr:hypothetical protein I204_01781 [Kwoniella mangroviensis CBS 8886]
MSLPHNGSTAPAITSPDLAWPSRPVARPSPLSTPTLSAESAEYLHSPSSSSRQASSSSTAPTTLSRSGSLKGKEKALDLQLRIHSHNTEEQEEREEKERNYGPPKKPLPPHQLGRIAQSFGIIMPNLPQSQTHSTHETRIPTSPLSTSAISPTLPSASYRCRLSPLPFQSPIRSTPFLLSVIPPLSLLPPNKDSSSEEIHRRNKKWRRGRLIPLQPTLGSMLVCIAREYGLPSTIGIGVYLVLPNQPTRKGGTNGSSSSSDESNYDDDEGSTGPKISSATWSTLFSPHLIQLAQGGGGGMNSRSSTPSQTPLKNNVYSNDIVDPESGFPPSPISTSKINPSRNHISRIRRSKSTEPPELVHSHSSNLSTSTSSFSANLPPTPASLGDTSFATTISSTASPMVTPIVGTIEFDVDLDEAKWFENYHQRKSGRHSKHKRSLTSESGMKELNLVNKVSDVRPRFLKELNPNTPQINHQDDHGSQESREKNVVEVDDDLLKPHPEQNDLLASPIDLSDQSTRLKVQEILDKRGSGVVMAEQLDDLEKMMRQLSPREIRITSPRLLTPRMAAKVANLTLPAVPKRGTSKTAPTSSPLAGDFSNGNSDSEEKSQPNSARSNGTFGSAIHLQQQQQATSQLQVEQVEDNDNDTEETTLDRPVWPAVKHGSPGSPTIHEYFSRPSFPQRQQQVRNASSPASIPVAISDETLKRMKENEESQIEQSKISSQSQERIPRRPARPPSPKLESMHQRTLSHTLSPELVDFLNKSPPPATGGQGTTPEEKRRNRSGSMSLKGLRNQMSSKNLSQMWKSGETSSTATSPPLPNEQKETIGLFKGGLPTSNGDEGHFGFDRDQAHSALGGGMRSVSSPTNPTTDFGAVSQTHDESSLPSAGSGSGKGKFASRIWGFRHHSDKHDKDKDRSSKMSSKRNPSIDGAGSIKISEPIAASFIHKESFDIPPNNSSIVQQQQQQQQAGLGHGRFPSHSYAHATPTSPNPSANPASPRSMKRKPVPGTTTEDGDSTMMIKNSMSLSSMNTFVLEDAPKGRKMMGLGMGQAQ